MNREPLCFWLLLAVFIGSVVGWILWTPFQPSLLYRAIPANATLVSSHDNLAGRWKHLSTNVILRSLISDLPATPDKSSVLTDSVKTETWMTRLASRKTVIAYVPSLGHSDEPAWIVTSWIGNTSLHIRWLLYWKSLHPFSQLGHYGGRPMWGLNQPITESGMKLSFSIVEGVLFGCLSRDPTGIRHMLKTYDGRTPSVVSTKFSQKIQDKDPQDWGWIRWPQKSRHTHNSTFILYQISLLNSGGLAGDIRIHSHMAPYPPLFNSTDLSTPGRLLSDFPAIIMILPLNMANDLLEAVKSQPQLVWAKVVKNLLKSDPVLPYDNAFVLSVLTGEYSGGFGLSGNHVLRVKIPAVMGMVKIKNAEAVHPLIHQALDTVNAEFRMGLIIDPFPLPAGNHSVRTIESTMDNFLSALAAEDRPAYTVFNDWLIFSTSARSLIKLLERSQNPDVDVLKGKWQEKLEATSASAFAWLDLKSVGQTLQLPLVLYSQKLKASHTTSALQTQLVLSFAKSWLQDVSPLKTGVIWMESPESQPVIHIEIGTPK